MAIKNHFQLKIKKINQTAYAVECFEENRCWMLRASKFKWWDLWKITKHVPNNSYQHDIKYSDCHQALSKMMRSCVRSSFMHNGGEKTDPGDIRTCDKILVCT